jgi:hypothetical protein
LCGIFMAAGCSRASTPADFDAGAARQTVTDALDAWKEGRAGQLSQASPPIRFVDDDLARGARLVNYEWPDTATSIRPFENVAVTLVLEYRMGKAVRKTVAYQVGLEPTVTVLRSEK